MMGPPLSSVIIPARNYGRYVAGAVDSALAQTYVPLEVIVVDDGSTDDTTRVLGRFGDRIRLLRLDGQGVAAARNAGLSAARGEFVVFLDADDLLLPDAVSRLAGYLRTHSGVDAVYGAWYQCDILLQRVFVAASRIRDGNILPRAFLGNVVSTPSAMLLRRQAVLAAGGFDPRVSFTADWEMWLRLALRGHRFAAVSPPVAVYRVHAHSMTKDLARASRDVWTVLDRYLAGPAVPSRIRAVRPDAYYEMGLYLAKLHLEQGDAAGAVPHLRTALEHRPDRAASVELYYYLSRAIRRHAVLAGAADPHGVAAATTHLAALLPWEDRRPGERRALIALAVALMLRHAGAYRAALNQLAAALRADPRIATAPRHLPIVARICLPPGFAALRRRRDGRAGQAPLPPLVATVMAEATLHARAGPGVSLQAE